MVGARVNGSIVKLDYEIQNGDRIDIITSQNSRGPSRDWLNLVKSSQAKNKINQWFRNEFKEDNIIKGKELLHTYCKTKALTFRFFCEMNIQQPASANMDFVTGSLCVPQLGTVV